MDDLMKDLIFKCASSLASEEYEEEICWYETKDFELTSEINSFYIKYMKSVIVNWNELDEPEIAKEYMDDLLKYLKSDSEKTKKELITESQIEVFDAFYPGDYINYLDLYDIKMLETVLGIKRKKVNHAKEYLEENKEKFMKQMFSDD